MKICPDVFAQAAQLIMSAWKIMMSGFSAQEEKLNVTLKKEAVFAAHVLLKENMG
jgi:hypothetical protein